MAVNTSRLLKGVACVLNFLLLVIPASKHIVTSSNENPTETEYMQTSHRHAIYNPVSIRLTLSLQGKKPLPFAEDIKPDACGLQPVPSCAVCLPNAPLLLQASKNLFPLFPNSTHLGEQ